MFYILKIIINIFLSIMSLIGIYFTYKKIQYSDRIFFMIVKIVILIFAAICFFVFAIKYLGEYKHNYHKE